MVIWVYSVCENLPSFIFKMLLLLFSHSVVSDFLRPHGLQLTRVPCPSLSAGVCSNPLVMPFKHLILSHPLSPPALSLSQHQSLFQWVGSLRQMVKVLEFKLQHQSFQWIQGWFLLGLIGLISLLSKGLLRVFPNTTVWKRRFFGAQPYLWSNSHIRTWLLKKLELWLYRPLLAQWILCFLIHYLGIVLSCLPKNKCLLISWLQSPYAVILEPKTIACHCLHCFRIYLAWSDENRCHDLSFLDVELG